MGARAAGPHLRATSGTSTPTVGRAFMLDIAQAMHSSHQVGHKYPTYKYSKPLMDCHVATLLAESVIPLWERGPLARIYTPPAALARLL